MFIGLKFKTSVSNILIYSICQILNFLNKWLIFGIGTFNHKDSGLKQVKEYCYSLYQLVIKFDCYT
jgi:hypothetical protein